jgi:voltage-gated potassium channel
MRMFIRFCYHFFIIIGHLQAVFLSLVGLIVISAAVIAHVEKLPFGEAIYFSFITGLTIGYGDIVVKTPLGRMIAVLLGLIGIVFTGLMVAAALRAVGKGMKDTGKS